MRTMALITATVMLALPPYLLTDAVCAERIAHHGMTVENSESPYDCIACHDGLVAPEAHFCTVECGFGSSHSIFKEYPPRSKEDSYAPAESLQKKGIRLFKGKVSCASCHDLRNQSKDHLIMDNGGSALCFSCHRT